MQSGQDVWVRVVSVPGLGQAEHRPAQLPPVLQQARGLAQPCEEMVQLARQVPRPAALALPVTVHQRVVHREGQLQSLRSAQCSAQVNFLPVSRAIQKSNSSRSTAEPCSEIGGSTLAKANGGSAYQQTGQRVVDLVGTVRQRPPRELLCQRLVVKGAT